MDATFNAICEVSLHEATPLLFSVGAVTEGTDAQARTTVRLQEAGKMVDGQDADTDTIVSAVRAYVHALNKLLVKRVRTELAAMGRLRVGKEAEPLDRAATYHSRRECHTLKRESGSPSISCGVGRYGSPRS